MNLDDLCVVSALIDAAIGMLGVFLQHVPFPERALRLEEPFSINIYDRTTGEVLDVSLVGAITRSSPRTGNHGFGSSRPGRRSGRPRRHSDGSFATGNSASHSDSSEQRALDYSRQHAHGHRLRSGQAQVMMRGRATFAVAALVGFLILMSTSPHHMILSMLSACSSGCTSDAQCGGNGVCCGGGCCNEVCCGDAQKGSCTNLQDDANCGACGDNCNAGGSCLLRSTCQPVTMQSVSCSGQPGPPITIYECTL